MPPRKRAAAGQGELPGVSSTKEIQDILWKAADKLRGSMDAAQYKEFVLGLVFLKYVSDAFHERREELAADPELAAIPEHRRAAFLEEKDEYTEKNVFWVPPTARWDHIKENASSAEGGVGKLLDEAMDEVMKANKTLTGVLPKIFNRDNVDQKRLKELVDLISDARFTGHGDRPAQDVLGETYEYFLGRFARAEGKLAGEFYTPASVVRLLVEVLEPYEGRVYDPACGSGGMFVQSGKFVASRRGKDHTHDIAVYGQEANERTWRLAKMNLAIHGMDPKGVGERWADTFADDKLPDLKADFVMANPPFNMSDWARKSDDPRWRYGVPPQSNANYAWLQHIVSKLGDRGSAGVVLSNGSMSSKQSGEGEIRAALVAADLVACMVALPANLFRTTAIPACLWFLTKDKSPQGTKALEDRRSRVLFIDARAMGTMLDRTERILTDADLEKISDTYHAWRGTRSAREKDLSYEDVAGFCYSATLEEIEKHDYVLTPGRYVGATEIEDDPDAEPVEDRIARLTKELFEHLDESARLDAVVREQLGRVV
ncbi:MULTISPECIES: type I restriction-modification system subunit M [Streptomyces]|uniref:site-specific DNA-methyltransferase (adenine-specific) n=1 Tax=Streptomyces tsukubensis (strain DSM 42081 / NBRC 108919 / NRRL 18488 / 9993) TaxID=1114943 RepID=I2N329_STRT9|nr:MULTISPECIES: class I SAM-dependent DNA methyltransferase [Streptomyces]AZK95534.1 restriction endonuclease subunit M [Streptomyces tsukubensis]EIF91426.1 Site-specific DNA-methyltransferase [Streptomyces tsukubensis NRRL18488]MYS66677.1 N-6 DNA methylase [Streptomyces sp. SID5473]QKM68426.1 SAM-dependent DNA methyltransferase [Streptomyces tsukubensis NRRL18488]TAI43244.1 SAM-dependent DNA methyltransferase [Streptomyces tsukubensis]